MTRVSRPAERSSVCDRRFLRQSRRLDGEIKKRVDMAMVYILESKNPRDCGEFKYREYVPMLNAKVPTNIPNLLALKKSLYLNTSRCYPYIILKVRLGPHCQYSLHKLEMTP